MLSLMLNNVIYVNKSMLWKNVNLITYVVVIITYNTVNVYCKLHYKNWHTCVVTRLYTHNLMTSTCNKFSLYKNCMWILIKITRSEVEMPLVVCQSRNQSYQTNKIYSLHYWTLSRKTTGKINVMLMIALTNVLLHIPFSIHVCAAY